MRRHLKPMTQESQAEWLSFEGVNFLGGNAGTGSASPRTLWWPGARNWMEERLGLGYRKAVNEHKASTPRLPFMPETTPSPRAAFHAPGIAPESPETEGPIITRPLLVLRGQFCFHERPLFLTTGYSVLGGETLFNLQLFLATHGFRVAVAALTTSPPLGTTNRDPRHGSPRSIRRRCLGTKRKSGAVTCLRHVENPTRNAHEPSSARAHDAVRFSTIEKTTEASPPEPAKFIDYHHFLVRKSHGRQGTAFPSPGRAPARSSRRSFPV